MTEGKRWWLAPDRRVVVVGCPADEWSDRSQAEVLRLGEMA